MSPTSAELTGGEPDSPPPAPSPPPLIRKPRWLVVPAPVGGGALRLGGLLRRHGLETVCTAASCPNRGRCWEEGSAAFLILGPVCTRHCTFCDVPAGRPVPPDPREPARLAAAVAELGLRHVVVTSVTRDDLPDGGAERFAAAIAALSRLDPAPTVEVLTPDFGGDPAALDRVLEAGPAVFNHNLETVPRLYGEVRPGADFGRSLELLRRAAAHGRGIGVKTGIMLGLGEELGEVRAVLGAARGAGARMVTIGQYLRPSLAHRPVARYWEPEWFVRLGEEARALGYEQVTSHPLARSSLHAGEALGHGG